MSPNWNSSRDLLAKYSPKEQSDMVQQLALYYPTWFFETLVKFEGKPLVLEDFQVRFLADSSAFRICNKSRQMGGSMQVAMDKLFKAYTRPGYRCDIISINLKEATDKIKYIRNFWDSLPKKYQIPLTTDNALSIGFHRGSNRSIVHSLAASAGVRGGKKEIFFDEFAHIPMGEELFYAAAPAALNGNLGIDLVSTPAGIHNLFASIYLNQADATSGRNPFANFSRHKFIWVDARRLVHEGMYEEAQHVWKVEYREDMNLMRDLVEKYANDKMLFFYHLYPWEMFKQEFCGAFVDDTNSFFPPILVNKCVKGPLGKVSTNDADYSEDFLEPWTSRPVDNMNEVFMGVDWAENRPGGDYTAAVIIELDPTTGRYLHRKTFMFTGKKFQGEFDPQIDEVVRIAREFSVTRVTVDHTGLGIYIGERLKKLLNEFGIPTELVDFHHNVKAQMTMNLKSLMEKDLLWLLAEDKALYAQLIGLKRKITESGNTLFSGEDHDDIYWALALAAKKGSHSPFAIYQIGAKGW